MKIPVMMSVFCAAALMASARESIAFVEAHPDDLAGHMGTALKLAEKYDIHVIDFTHGERGCGEEKFKSGWTKATRTAEETAVCGRAGFKLHWCDAVDGEAWANETETKKLAAYLKEINPRAVICHWPVDVHRDHVMSAAATFRALDLAGIRPEVYFHEQDIQSRRFPVSYHVDVTPYVEKKFELTKLYACQGGEEIANRKRNSSKVRALHIGLGEMRNVEIFATFPGTVKPGQSIFDGLDGVEQ